MFPDDVGRKLRNISATSLDLYKITYEFIPFKTMSMCSKKQSLKRDVLNENRLANEGRFSMHLLSKYSSAASSPANAGKPSFILFGGICLFLLLCASMYPVEATSFTQAQLEKLYCGGSDCYSILNVSRTTPKQEITKTFRKLAKTLHPDRNTESPNAAYEFAKLQKAYQVLNDDKTREAYDYYLDHPDDIYSLFYGIRTANTNQVPLLLVAVMALFFISLVQYVNESFRYSRNRNIIRQLTSFQKIVKKKIEDEYGSRFRRLTEGKQLEIKKGVEEQLLDESVMVDGMNVKKMSWNDVFVVKFVMVPYWIFMFILWEFRWWYKFAYLKQAYGDDEKEYLTRKVLGMSKLKWQSLPEDSQKEMLAQELWYADKYEEYLNKVQMKAKEEALNSGRYRRAVRQRRKHSPTFYADD